MLNFSQPLSQKTKQAVQAAVNIDAQIAPIARGIKGTANTGIQWGEMLSFLFFCGSVFMTFEHTSDILTGSESFISAPIQYMNQLFLGGSSQSVLAIICGSISSALSITFLLTGIGLHLFLISASANFAKHHLRNALNYVNAPPPFTNGLLTVLTAAYTVTSLIYGIPLIQATSTLLATAIGAGLGYALTAGLIIAVPLLGLSAATYFLFKAFNKPSPLHLPPVLLHYLKKALEAISAPSSYKKAFNLMSLVLVGSFILFASNWNLLTMLALSVTLVLQRQLFSFSFACNLAALTATHKILKVTAEKIAFSYLAICELIKGNSKIHNVSFLAFSNLVSALNAFKEAHHFNPNNDGDLKAFICFLRDNDYKQELITLTVLGADGDECHYDAPEIFAANQVIPSDELNLTPANKTLAWTCAKVIAQNQLPLDSLNLPSKTIAEGCSDFMAQERRRKGL